MKPMMKAVLTMSMLLFAVSTFASNFRAADIVYLPAIVRGEGANQSFFKTDLFINNVSSGSIDVTISFLPIGGGDNRDAALNPRTVGTISAGGMLTVTDAVQTILGTSAFGGQAILFACRAGGDCVNNENDLRDITVQARVYTEGSGVLCPNNAASCSFGQLFTGQPWYAYISASAAADQLDRALITGIIANDDFRSNIGIANASEWSSTTIRVELFNQNGNRIGTFNENLAPLGMNQRGITNMFPGFTGRGYVVLTQTGVTPTNPGDEEVGDGVPGFFAYGSVLARSTNDPITQEAMFMVPIDLSVYSPQNPLSKAGDEPVKFRRAVRHR